MKISRTQNILAKQILFFNGLIFVTIIVYFSFGAFDLEELTSVLALISAIAAMYIGTFFKYLIELVKSSKVSLNEQELSYLPWIQWLIPIHFILLVTIFSIKAFAIIDFKEMNMILAVVETSYGGYMSYLVHSIFFYDIRSINE